MRGHGGARGVHAEELDRVHLKTGLAPIGVGYTDGTHLATYKCEAVSITQLVKRSWISFRAEM